MGYWSVAILVISVSFLAYRHPEATRNALPPWLRSRKSSILSAGKDETEPVDDEKESEVEGDAPSFKVSEPEETEQGDETPKSNAIQPKDAVPSFSLSDDKNNENDIKPIPKLASNQTTEPTNPSPPTLSPQTTMAPPPALAPPKPSSSSLMPPPAPKPSTLMPPPSRPTPLPNRNPTSTLRTPQANLLPNRGPPTNSQQRAGSSNNGKGKILLSPGHSPMDWAALSRDPKANLAGVPSLQRVTPSQLKTMTGRKGKPAWSSYHGKVYNLTPYLPFHPGGEPELMRAAGRDGGKLFMEVHPWVNWEGMLSSCVVGILVGESEGVSEMEEMD